MFYHHLRRNILSRPVIFASHHQSHLHATKCSDTYLSVHNLHSSPSSYFNVSNYSSFVTKGSGSKFHILQNSFCLPRKLSAAGRNFVYNHNTHAFKFSSETSSAYCSKILTSRRSLHQNDYRTKLLLSSQLTETINFIREGHLLSRKHQCPPILTHKLQRLPSNMTNTSGNIQQTRPINIPNLILNASPTPWRPYLELIRFDKPIGTWLLYWPCTWSIALAAQPGCLPDFYYLALFGAGAFFMRGAGCIINDMWDKDFDTKVERTKERPLACGKVSYPQALVFLASQLSISLAILFQLNWYSIGLGVASLGFVITYPTFKRFTYWPQVALGLTFNYGALLGWAAVRGSCDWSICIPLYFLCHMWTMIYDTVYAHQDKSDDILVGVKSTALKFGDQTKWWLAGFTTLMAGGLLSVGHFAHMTWPYYAGASVSIASILMQLHRLNIDDPQACGDAFRFHFYIGLLMFVSIMFGNLVKPKEKEEIMIEPVLDGQLA